MESTESKTAVKEVEPQTVESIREKLENMTEQERKVLLVFIEERKKREGGSPAEIITDLACYISEKFSAGNAEKLCRRFMLEAQAEFAADTPGNEVSQEEHLSYATNKVVEALQNLTPMYRRQILYKYIKDIMPKADADYDQAEDEAVPHVLFGDIERGTAVRDAIEAMENMTTRQIQRFCKSRKK